MPQVRNLFIFIIFCFSFAVLQKAYAIPTKGFNFEDWPKEMRDQFYNQIPELEIKNPTDDELNTILKKMYSLYSFDQLSLVEKDNTYYVVGRITSQIKDILFEGLQEISLDEVKETLRFSTLDALEPQKVQTAQEKLIEFLKNRGFRNAHVRWEYRSVNTVHRNLVFVIQQGVKTRISRVDISGLKTEDKLSLESDLYWGHVGQVLTEDILKSIHQKLRQSLSQRGYFLINTPPPQIFYSADDSKARVAYRLQSQPQYKVEIIGSSLFSETYLYLDVLKLDTYFSSENNFGAELSEKLRQFYNERGYDLFEVTYFERKEKDRIVLTLSVDEGPRVTVDEVQIMGAISRPQKYYVKKFFELASQKVQDKLLVRQDIERAAKNLMTYLQNEGYVNAKLKRLSYSTKQGNPHQALVILNIDEGSPTLIQKIFFNGDPQLSSEQMLKALGLQEGQILNLNELEKGLLNLKYVFAENGFIEVKIANELNELVQYSDDLTQADLNIYIEQGPKVYVHSVVLEGNNITKDKIIFTELEFKPSDVLTPQKIQESIARGLFSAIEVTTLEAGTKVSERTVVVKVNERKPKILTFGIGATNENERTFHAYIGAAHRNLGGWGRGLSGRAEVNYNDVFLKFLESKITLGYLEPYLFDTRARFRINYTTSRSVTDVVLRKQTIANSAVWSVEQDFTSHLTGIWDIYNVSNFVEKGITSQDEIEHNYTSQDFVIASTGPTVDIDYRDNVVNPQNGNFSRFSLEYAAHLLGSNKIDDFVRLTAQTTFYTPFTWTTATGENKIVWANSVRGGYIQPVAKVEYGIPYDKRGFILGGRSTIRGFESTEFFPSTNAQNPENIGSNFRLSTPAQFQLFKSEIRFPLMHKYDLGAAIFYDGGQVLIKDLPLTDRYRDAVGIGLRYNTPVGPLSLEYAHKLDRKDWESPGAFHLSVGVF